MAAVQSAVEIEIGVARGKAAALLGDPRNNAHWMDDVDRIEPVSGELGWPGSKYRIVPKRGRSPFLVTVVSRNLPGQLSLQLEAGNFTVIVETTLEPLAPDRTRLVSRETAAFHGALSGLLAAFSGRAIRLAHRHQMQAFKRFAESRATEAVEAH